MNRQEKEHVIKTLKQEFNNSQASFIVQYKGLDVSQITNLRKKLRQENGILQVAKITLMRRALQNIDYAEAFEPFLENQIAVVFARKEPPAIAKILFDFSKEFEQVKIMGGSYGTSYLTKEQIEIFASLPSREVLLAQLCGALKAPINRLALVLHMQAQKLLSVLKQLEEQKKK